MKEAKVKALEVVKEKTMKLNVKYVIFVAKLIATKQDALNKEALSSIYTDEVQLRPTNIQRVASRNLRPELKHTLEAVLKANKLEFKDYKKASDKIVEKLNESKSENYETVVV